MKLSAAAVLLALTASDVKATGMRGTASAKPNIIVVMVDDLGYNQVGYHASPQGNTEIQTPSIDKHATEGIRMERGYMTPWCAPSRAAFQTGTMTSFNGELTNNVYAFDDDIGFIGGLQDGTKTLASALKAYAPEYTTSYAGKWGIGGTSWANTPVALGYDSFRGYWGDSIDSCDGWVPTSSVPGVGGDMMRAVSGYWTQNAGTSNDLCEQIMLLDDETLSAKEKEIACNSSPIKPSQIIDADLLQHTTDIISNHDYSSGPLYHMHATQVLHLPMQYPEKYDEGMPWYGLDEMPPATNDMLRMKTANIVKFMDDIFESIMQSVKSTGQWDNTIVLFTTDNGGAIYTNSANNNFPLRGSKLSSFEGGLRVTQFLSGGWIDKQLPASRSTESDTYVVVNDWAPTLLGMAGGDKSYLLGDFLEGNTQGNNMWEYIQNSVTNNPTEPHQMPRNVTFSPRLTLEIEENSARKYINTGDDKVFFARKWSANFPQETDVIPDFGYASINPCRPGGTAMQCCYFDVEADPEEDNPLTADCDALADYAEQTYYDQHVCSEKPQLCVNSTSLKIPGEREQGEYDLWTLYDASGPFTNGTGFPITADLLGEKPACVCAALQEGLDEADVNAFIPTPESPTICVDKDTLSAEERLRAIDCEGVKRVTYTGASYLESYMNEGIFNRTNLENWFHADRSGQVQRLLQVPTILQILHEYITREGFAHFPNMPKWPFIAADQDTCADKQVTPNPLPVLALTPWFATQGDVTMPSGSPRTLCNPYGPSLNFCASKQNPLQEKIIAFDYSAGSPSFTLASGEVVPALTHLECETHCRGTATGTAYIGNGPNGITV